MRQNLSRVLHLTSGFFSGGVALFPWLAVSLILIGSQYYLATARPALTHVSVVAIADVLPLIAVLGLSTAAMLVIVGSQIECAVPRPFWVLVVTGLLMRLVWVGQPVPLEDDFYRYLWDGAVIANGQNPYPHSPEAALTGVGVSDTLSGLAKSHLDVVQRINFPELTTMYPVTAQFVFALAHALAAWDVEGLRLVFIAAEVTTLTLMLSVLRALRLNRMRAMLYWCCPLPVFSTAATLHIEAVLSITLLAAVRLAMANRHRLAGLVLGLAVGIKVWPLLLGPVFWRAMPADRRMRLAAAGVFVGTSAIVLYPMLTVATGPGSFLVAYSVSWWINNVAFAWASLATYWVLGPEPWAQIVLRAFVAGLACLASIWVALPGYAPEQRDADLAFRSGLVAAIVFYVSPAQFPWYALWFYPFAAISICWPLLAAAVTLPAYYLFFPLANQGERDVFQYGLSALHLSAPTIVLAYQLLKRGLFHR
jgi:hypothetical protein